MRPFASSKKTDIKIEVKPESDFDAPRCPTHKNKHSLHDCSGFKTMSFEERWAFLKNDHLCFQWLSTEHDEKKIKCHDCGSDRHCTTMQIIREKSDQSLYGEETSKRSVASKCTHI